jgi:hypothetical protein
MYWVKIRLDNGSEVHYTESPILRAAARVEEYREHMVFCDIQLIKEEGKDGDQESS